MASTRLSRLTPYFRSHPLFEQVADLIADAKVMQGFLLYTKDEKDYLLLKDGTLHSPLDWQAFSIMRAYAHCLLGTGLVIRKQSGIYLSRQSYGDKNIDELYQNMLGTQKQKLIILSRNMTRAELQKEVNPKFYELKNLPQFSSLTQLVQKASQQANGPLLVQVGLKTMEQYFKEVSQGKKNTIDSIMITRYEGDISQNCIGQRSNLPLTSLYKRIWKSEPIFCPLSDNKTGKLTFETYKLK